MKNRLNNKGFINTLELLMIAGLLLLFSLLPVGFGVFYFKQNVLLNIADTGIELMQVHGGLTSDIENELKKMAEDGRLNPSDLTLTVDPAEANYADETNFLLRGNTMTLTVEYPGDNVLNSITQIVGFKALPDHWKYSIKRTGMSQKWN